MREYKWEGAEMEGSAMRRIGIFLCIGAYSYMYKHIYMGEWK